MIYSTPWKNYHIPWKLMINGWKMTFPFRNGPISLGDKFLHFRVFGTVSPVSPPSLSIDGSGGKKQRSTSQGKIQGWGGGVPLQWRNSLEDRFLEPVIFFGRTELQWRYCRWVYRRFKSGFAFGFAFGSYKQCLKLRNKQCNHLIQVLFFLVVSKRRFKMEGFDVVPNPTQPSLEVASDKPGNEMAVSLDARGAEF